MSNLFGHNFKIKINKMSKKNAYEVHDLKRLDRILALCRLAAQHDAIRAVQHWMAFHLQIYFHFVTINYSLVFIGKSRFWIDLTKFWNTYLTLSVLWEKQTCLQKQPTIKYSKKVSKPPKKWTWHFFFLILPWIKILRTLGFVVATSATFWPILDTNLRWPHRCLRPVSDGACSPWTRAKNQQY